MSNRKSLIKKEEDSVQFYLYKEDAQNIPSKSMNVFYNKSMELNRDLSNLALKSYDLLFSKKPLIVVDCMAASGIGSIRMLKDCQNIYMLYVNDINPVAVELIKLNFRFNNINIDKVSLSQKDASLLLLEIKNQQNNDKPDVISIDPFGTPNIYMDSVFKVINKKKGLICITATDTAVLFGVRSDACLRKYLSKPLRVEYSKEIGARILLHFISRIANINNLGIFPLLTFYSNHFLRIFALTFKNKDKISHFFSNYGYIIHCEKCGYRQVINIGDFILNSTCPLCKKPIHQFSYAGPLWIGKIHDELFIKQMLEENSNLNYANRKKIDKLLKIIIQETNMPISYYNIHHLCKKLNLSQIPKIQSIIKIINELKYEATRTHFDPLSIKTNLPLNSLKDILIESL
jgi:tRNA (guanine26-N2/guanine27-N2)-dimethyltransferase